MLSNPPFGLVISLSGMTALNPNGMSELKLSVNCPRLDLVTTSLGKREVRIR